MAQELGNTGEVFLDFFCCGWLHLDPIAADCEMYRKNGEVIVD
jgi:hypothetical protein